MKKRSMLAVASLAVGVVASLTAPSAHATEPSDSGLAPEAVTAPELAGVVDQPSRPLLPGEEQSGLLA